MFYLLEVRNCFCVSVFEEEVRHGFQFHVVP